MELIFPRSTLARFGGIVCATGATVVAAAAVSDGVVVCFTGAASLAGAG